jgi:hypothetical protein
LHSSVEVRKLNTDISSREYTVGFIDRENHPPIRLTSRKSRPTRKAFAFPYLRSGHSLASMAAWLCQAVCAVHPLQPLTKEYAMQNEIPSQKTEHPNSDSSEVRANDPKRGGDPRNGDMRKGDVRKGDTRKDERSQGRQGK